MKLWSDTSQLWLLTPEEYDELPDGVYVKSITGRIKMIGVDDIDYVYEAGVMAVGLTPDLAKRQGLDDLFLFWRLKS